MRARRKGGRQANAITPRTRFTIEGEIPSKISGPAIQLSPRECSCFRRRLKDESVEEENLVGWTGRRSSV